MSSGKTVMLLTSIVPDSQNRGGPSGLPWEILTAIEQAGCNVSVQLVPLPQDPVRRRLTQLALFTNKIKLSEMNADIFLVYPSYLARVIPCSLRSKTFVLGPDAASMLYARFARLESGWRRIRSLLLSNWFTMFERWVISNFGGMIVVGRNDCRWLKQTVESAHKSRVHYLPHPVLSSINKSVFYLGINGKCRLVFGGDLSKKYVGSFFETVDLISVATALRVANCEVVVVGKANRLIFEAISKHLPATYEEWVEHYALLCDPLRDIHVIPLFAGAGTKNRTISALVRNVVILSTFIGIENINSRVLSSSFLYKFRSAAEFPTALNLALANLNKRRLDKTPPVAPPVVHITNSFYGSIDIILGLNTASFPAGNL